MPATWYVIRCRHELRVRDELADLGLLGYVPCERVKVRRGRDKVPAERPVWRGYVFVIAADDWPAALVIDGVHDFIRYEIDGSRVPLPIPHNLLEPIIAAEWDGDLDYVAQAAYEPQRGDDVRIKSGKWKGWLGRVISVAKRRAIVQTDKGIAARITIDADRLERAA